MIFDWNLAWSITPVLFVGALVTFEATVIGFTLAIFIALPLALARRSRALLLAWPIGFLIEFIRSTPLLVQLYFIFFVGPRFGITLPPMSAGLIAIGLYYGCFISEVYRAGLDSVSKGQWEAATALNLGRWRTYKDVILPQATPPMIPALGNYLIDMFKATPVLSVISVSELMERAKLIGSETFRYTEPITLVGGGFLIMSLASSRLVQRLEQLFGAQRQRRGATDRQIETSIAGT
ncbi:ectoine/hydroxyectoine ABC transporter permease subunit EhuD [Bradyrhizobium sp. 144]|uniref:ectoine/hydroxyectoine ABC transporter permease subunit EhuD n=1 Tax=Bradyrhizobium sp. 144 TaxID=2782620 RepID=UPI001FFBCE24|nr:ectoine/hydroxyectoine ABC transporter permease subunit EhuD [Bradyrhizobium sp. 144]MCK1699431.1 ectoine/hydroxyectoine ABC transporter permease subunit EhuD [Bradyrhizobium sp. 144]